MQAVILELPDELAMRSSKGSSSRLDELLSKHRDEGLSAIEQRDWELYAYLEHLVRVAEASAIRRVAEASGDAQDQREKLVKSGCASIPDACADRPRPEPGQYA